MRSMKYSLCIVFVVLLALYSCVQSEKLYTPPKPAGEVVFLETFDPSWDSRWIISSDSKYNGAWKVVEGEEPAGIPEDKGLVVNSIAKHHAISAAFSKPLDTTGKDLVIQYEVRFQRGIECGGAYLKFLSHDAKINLKTLNNGDPYIIMFGPDKCGSDSKLHFILRHQNPLTKEWQEKHATPRPTNIRVDKQTHLYTLHVHSNNSFEMYVDREVTKRGDLLTDMQPPVNPPKEIPDPSDKKPADWVDNEYIPDPTAKKPDDWDEDAPASIVDPDAKKPDDWYDDEPEYIPDPTAKKPDDWNDEEDGEYVAPNVPNPRCELGSGCGEWIPPTKRNPLHKGKWFPPQIKNPKFIGDWKPRNISNPNYYEDKHPANFPKMAGIGIEIWTMTDGIMFDNILVTHDKSVADDFAQKSWNVKSKAEKDKQAEEEQQQKEKWAQDHEQGYVDTALEYLNIGWKYALDNPALVGASIFIGVLPILICVFFKPGKTTPSKKQSKKEKKEEKEEEEVEVQEEEEQEEQEEPEEEIVMEEKVKPVKQDSPAKQRKQKQKEIVEEKEDNSAKKNKKRTPRVQ